MSSRAYLRLNQVASALAGTPVEITTLSKSECASHVAEVPIAAPDAIFFVAQSFKKDTDPRKVNVGIGAYRTDDGKPFVLSCVKKAEERIFNDKARNKEYLAQGGDEKFLTVAAKAMFGPSKALAEGKVASVQTLSGTGALRIAAEFFAAFKKGLPVLISNPTWGNHNSIFKQAGCPERIYRYWDPKKRGLDLEGMLADLRAAPTGSVVLLHTCAHNPTGVDPTREQWQKIADVVREKHLYTLFDTAYQGFATGSLEDDCWPVRLWDSLDLEFGVCQSFAKNIGLYGERIGALHFRTLNTRDKDAILSQIELFIRWSYSNPPMHGAAVVATVLGDPELYALWQKELTEMSHRIISMRVALKKRLVELKTPGTWDHITSQIGMFSFSGLTPAQSEAMTKKHHIYMLKNGRISMAGVTSKNVSYIAEAIDDVVRNVQ